MRRKKRRIKWGRVLFLIIFLMIIVGGIYVFNGLKKDDKLKVDNKKSDVINKVDDSNSVNKDLDKAPSNSIEYGNLSDGEYITNKNFVVKKENGISRVDGYLIVNKTYSLPSSFVPENPYNGQVGSDWCIDCIDKEAMEAFKLMQSDAKALGLNIYIASGYRGYNKQVTLYNNYVNMDGKEMADTYSARAGHSEHQSGLCFDLNSVEDSFADTNEGKWVNNNAYLYGFIIRFPKGLENETGYKYESWHLRYVGKDLASKLYNNGNWISMEGYFGLTSNY